MKKAIYILFVIGLLFTFGSCEMRDELRSDKDKLKIDEGIIDLQLKVDNYANPVITTRGHFPDDEVDMNKYTIKIVEISPDNEIGNVVKQCSYPELMEEEGQVVLVAGKYRVMAYNYDASALATSERPFFLGQTDFQILAGKTTTVNTTCRLQMLEVYLKIPDSFKETFKDDYSITLTIGQTGVYIFNKDNVHKKVYFSIPENQANITMTVKATTKGNIPAGGTFTITKEPQGSEDSPYWEKGNSLEITVNIKNGPEVNPNGEIKWDISVDLTMPETGETIEIPTENIVYNPNTEPGPGENENQIEVTGLNKTYNIDSDFGVAVPTVQVSLSVPNGIKKLLVNIESDNEGFVGALEGLRLNDEFDIANPGDLLPVLSNSIESGDGIGLIDADDSIKDKTTYLFDITEFMGMLKLFGVSENTFTITVSDGVNEDVTGKLHVNVIGEIE